MFLGRTLIYWFDPSFKLISCNEPGRPGATSKFRPLVYDEDKRLKFLVFNKFSLTFFVTNPKGLMTVL
jgi:hypothetical protein